SGVANEMAGFRINRLSIRRFSATRPRPSAAPRSPPPNNCERNERREKRQVIPDWKLVPEADVLGDEDQEQERARHHRRPARSPDESSHRPGRERRNSAD